MSKQTLFQVLRFLCVGSVVTLIDCIVYTLCLLANLPINLSKGLSFVAAVIFAYYAHKKWTFRIPRHSTKQIILFFNLYIFNLGLNVVSNNLFLDWLGHSFMGFALSFLGATTLCAITNFIGQKYLVFAPEKIGAQVK